MKIGMKLTLGFSLTVIAMALTVAFCLNTGEKMHEEFEALKDDIIPGAIAMADMAHYADKIHLCIMEYIVAGEYGQEKLQSTMQLLEKAGTEHLEHEKHIGLEEKNAAEGLLARIKRVNSAAMEIVNSKDQGRSIAELTSKEDQEFHPAMVALLKQLNEHKATHMAESAVAEETVHEAHVSGKRIALLVSGIVALLAAVIAFATTRSITKPLVALHKGTEIIGSGKLDYQIATNAKDEIGQLSRAFDEMTCNLKTTIASRDELDAANQQLQAHQQQLRVTNQQLDASNQQLRAIEQQLRASNQQLQAGEQQLKASNQHLRAKEQQLKASNQHLRAKEQQLLSSNHNLNERVKELNGLYGLSKVIETPNITLPVIFQRLAELLPPSWQYPEITCGRVIFEDDEFKTDNFEETQWLQSADIKVFGEKRGTIDVYYLRECPLLDEGPFLKEGRDLINLLAERLSRVIERIQAGEEKVEIIAEMERMNRLMTGREMRVIEMKKEVNALLKELGKEPEYKSVLEETEAVVSSDKAG